MKTKKTILIFGLTANFGGMEKLTYTLLSYIDCSNYCFVFVNSSNTEIKIDERLNIFETQTITFNSKRKGRYGAFKKDLEHIYKEVKPDIVLEVFGDSTYVEPLIFAKKYGVKKRIALGTMGDDVSNPGLKYKLLRLISKIRLNNSVTHRLSVSAKSSHYTFGKSKNVNIISGIDSEQFKYNKDERIRLRQQYSIKNNDVVFSMIGRICPDKNQLFAINYFYSYHSFNNNSYLFLIGNFEEDYKKTLINRIHSLKLEQYVLFIGPQPNVKAFYSFSDIVLFPSLREGFGLIAVESQANGVPCLVFKETIDTSLQVTDNLIFIDKKIEDTKVINLVNKVLSKRSIREDDYLKVKNSFLDLSSQKEIIKKVFE